MDQNVKKLWVAALRSGEYEQTTKQLREVDEKGNTIGFCCLGILCNLHAQAHPDIAAAQTEKERYMEKAFMPHTKVLEWAGLDINTDVSINGDNGRLYYHNDIGKSFEQIAKAIEEQL